MEPNKTAKIITVVGARPNFMKAAPIIAAIRDHNERLAMSPGLEGTGDSQFTLRNVLVHTGQHYDEAMSDRFFADLNIPKPDVHLGVGSGSHAAQTAEIMKRFEEVLLRERPDLLIVVGDVNSTLGLRLGCRQDFVRCQRNQAAHCPCRSRPSFIRSGDARGNQSDPHGPRRRLTICDRGERAPEICATKASRTEKFISSATP